AATHGGLLPEEVVIGVSVLQKAVTRLPIIVTCIGEGTAGKPGNLKIKNHKPNPAPVHEVTIYLHQKKGLRARKKEGKVIKANSHEEIELSIVRTPIPELKADTQGPGNMVNLSGRVVFRISGVEPAEATISKANSVFKVNQIFQSGGIDIDEFL